MRAVVTVSWMVLAACGDDVANQLPDAPRAPEGAGIYVTNEANRILVFSPSASGDVAPQRVIEGAQTGLSLVIGMDVDADGNLYVANRTASTVTVYPKSATGDVAPARTLTAPGMGSPEGIAITSTGGVYVSTCPTCGTGAGGQTGIWHFPAGATTHDRVIGGATNTSTGFTNPGAIAIDRTTDTLYVGNSFGGNVSAWPATAQGDVAPARAFSPGSGNLQWIAYANDTVFVNMPGQGIMQFAASSDGAGAMPASIIPYGGDLPISFPGGISVDTSVTPPDIYLSDYSGDAVYLVRTTGTAPNLAIGSVVRIGGPATRIEAPLNIRVIR